jgi:hypothetical protein
MRDNLNVLKTEIRDSGLLKLLVVKAGAAGNVGSGETDLTGYTYTVPGGELADNEGYEGFIAGSLAANTNTKTLRIDVGGQKTTLVLNTTNVASNRFEVWWQVTRDAATTGRLSARSTFNAAGGAAPTLWHFGGQAIASLVWASNTTIKLTAQSNAVSSNDIVAVGGWFRRLIQS